MSDGMSDAYSEFGTSLNASNNKNKYKSVMPKDECEAEMKKEKEVSTNKDSCWFVPEKGKFVRGYETNSTLPSGVYSISHSDRYGYLFIEQILIADNYLKFEDSQLNEILDDIDLFWAKESEYKKYGFTHKRGLLLFGPAGGGKSILINQAVARFVSGSDGVVVLGTEHPNALLEGVRLLRAIEPDRKILMIFEDIDAYIQNYGEEVLLSFLDGELTFDKCFIVATTNYPEKLDKRIINRPRRFDRIIRINPPTEKMRSIYLTTKFKIGDTELEDYIRLTEGFTFAALAEFVISVKCLGKDPIIVSKTLKELITTKKSSEDENSSMGFNN
jgi:hypothetical protein